MYAYRNSWKLGDGLCSFLESLLYVNMYGSILIIACISVDRYIALRHPFFAKTIRSPRKATVACIAIWIIIFGASGPVYKLHGKNTTDCFKTFSNETWNKVHIVVGMETVFIASALVLIFCSIHVIKILITMQKRNTGDQQLLNNKSIKIILTNLISFLVCFIPYHIAVPMYFMKKKQNMNSDPLIDSLRNFIHISICLTSINCLFDGICYYFIIKEITISARQTATETTELTDVFRKTSKRTCTNLRTQLSKDDNQQLSLT
ncbi:G-protein coupled receptor 55a isoform X2 [Amia ocellicauda]